MSNTNEVYQKPKVGDTLYLMDRKELLEKKVVRVGRKYFYYGPPGCDKGDWAIRREEFEYYYAGQTKLYPSVEAYDTQSIKRALSKEISEHLSGYSAEQTLSELPMQSLESIIKLLQIGDSK